MNPHFVFSLPLPDASRVQGPPVVSPTSFVFDRQRIVVAGEDSPTVAFTIAILRSDGHCVTHAADTGTASWDLALRDCHLLIEVIGTKNAAPTDLFDELRDRLPALALLRLSEASPFSAQELQAAVRPLLPKLRIGSVLARKSGANWSECDTWPRQM